MAIQPNTDNFIEQNFGLVHSVCHKFTGEYDDLFQIGCIGLIKAVRTFNPSHGTAFSSYAVPIIRNEILTSFRKKRIMPISLDEPIGEDEKGNTMTLYDTLASDKDVEADIINKAEMSEKLSVLTSLMSPRYLVVLSGYLSGKRQLEISKETGLSRQYVNKLIMEIRKRGAVIDSDYQTGNKSRLKRLGKLDKEVKHG